MISEANEALRPMHDRRPIILHSEVYDLCLDNDVRELSLIKELPRPYPSSETLLYYVTTPVNSTNNPGTSAQRLSASLESSQTHASCCRCSYGKVLNAF